MGSALAQDQQQGVFSGDRAHQGGVAVLVDQRSHHVGAARQGLDDAHLSREVDADDAFARPAVGKKDVLGAVRFGEDVAVCTRCIALFGDVEFPQIPRECGLGGLDAFFSKEGG